MEFDKTPRFWYPCVARDAWIDFSFRTVKLRPSERRENLHFFISPLSFSLSLSISVFLFFFFPCLVLFLLLFPPPLFLSTEFFFLCLLPSHFSFSFSFSLFSHFFLSFIFSYISFSLLAFLFDPHQTNWSSGETSSPLSLLDTCHSLNFSLIFFIFLSFFIPHLTLDSM